MRPVTVPSAPVKASQLAQIRALVAAGKTVDAACRAVGVSRPTYHRWAANEAKAGLAGLKDGKPTGRPKALSLTPEETAGLRGCSLIAGSMDGGVALWMREGAKPLELREWPEHAAPVPSTLATLIVIADEAREANRRPSWPLAVREALRTTANERARLRGGKVLLSVTPYARRAMHWIDEKGESHFINPGDIFESDDMSINEPFRYYDAELKRETVGRQTLITGDTFSHVMLGFTAIARRRQAYRVEDIAYHFRDTVNLYGLPLIWRVEKGVWDNDFIYGIKAPPSWLLPDTFRFGGLDGHLFRVAQKHTSRGKGGMENCFGPFQDFMKHKSTSIGAYRGEFDHASRLYRAALNGVPRGLGAFWNLDECASGMVEAMQDYNARPQLRRAFGGKLTVPAQQWAEAKGRACPAGEAWRFSPIKRAITVRNGVVEMKVEHYPLSFRFAVTGSPDCPTLDQGYRVFVAFDPGVPERGCHIFNGEIRGSKASRTGADLLAPMGIAQWWQDVPQENFSATAAESYGMQKRASAALRAEFRSAFPNGAGALISRSDAKDIYGRLAANPIQVAEPETAATKAARPRRMDGAELAALYSSAG